MTTIVCHYRHSGKIIWFLSQTGKLYSYLQRRWELRISATETGLTEVKQAPCRCVSSSKNEKKGWEKVIYS